MDSLLPEIRENLIAAIMDADRAGANRILDDWARTEGYDRVVTLLLTPVLEEIGRRWADSQATSLAQGYVAAKVAEDVLEKLLESRKLRSPRELARKGPVVLANIEDDCHPLGRKMVGAFLRLDGWDVRDLGLDVPPAALVDEAVATGARVIGASAMMYATARNIQRVREELNRRGLEGRVQLAVGGAVFKLRPELVADVGGDGTAASALEAPALFDHLWGRSLAHESGQG